MAFLPLRKVPLPTATDTAYQSWLDALDAELESPQCDRYVLCERILRDIYAPWPASDPTGVGALQFDARSITMEPEYYEDVDREAYARVKPLIWLWEMFDKSPMGENVHLGVRFRRILARRIFRSCGANFKAFHHVKLSFGYNLDVGDDVVVHRHALLDDRGGIRLDDGASVSDWVNIYSHSHDLADPREVFTPKTTICRGVRIAYHATVLSGITMGEYSMAGAGALVTKDVAPHTLVAGVPARPLREKGKPTRDVEPDPLARPV